MLNGAKFRIAGQNRPRQAMGHGDTKGIRVGDRMLALDLRCLVYQRQVHGHQLDGQSFEEMEGLGRPGARTKRPPSSINCTLPPALNPSLGRSFRGIRIFPFAEIWETGMETFSILCGVY